MNQEMLFFIYLLEHYAEYKDKPADIILRQWDSAGLSQLIYDMYEQYHTEAIENAYMDIDNLLAERNSASR